MPKKARILLVVLVAVVGGSIWYYRQQHTPQQTGTLTLYGNVDIREVRLAFNGSGHITSMLAQEGAVVKRGDLLATIDDTRYAAALAQAKANVAAAKVTYLNDQVNYNRYALLTKANASSHQLRDNAKARFDAGVAAYDAAVAAVALAQRQLDDTRLYAPDDGIIENRVLQPGDMASPSAVVYTMALPSPLWVRAYVTERDVGRVRLGQSATISTDSYPGRLYHGWIGYLSPTAEFTPKTVETPELRTALVYQIRVYVCDTRGELRMGMPSTVQIDLNQPITKAYQGCDAVHAAGQ